MKEQKIGLHTCHAFHVDTVQSIKARGAEANLLSRIASRNIDEIPATEIKIQSELFLSQMKMLSEVSHKQELKLSEAICNGAFRPKAK